MSTIHDVSDKRLSAILPLLACVSCTASLLSEGGKIRCSSCSRVYPLRSGVPVILPEDMEEPGIGTVSAEEPVSKHPYSPAALEIIEANVGGWVLDLGAGGKLTRFDNVVQIDIFRYPMTDVVGTADRLPFRDNAFRAVVSQAVFEHLQYPEWAAAEIRRVLQPNGVAKIDTAFLQPEHGYPHHFFNASETGLRHWFREFDIRWSGVEPYQHPKWSLSWFLGVYLDRVESTASTLLRGSTLDQVLGALLRSGEASATSLDGPILEALDTLPAHAHRILAAGVSVHAVNPPKTFLTPDFLVSDASTSVRGDPNEAARKLITAKDESDLLHTQLSAFREQYILAMDKARYLAQFYPGRAILAHLGLRAWCQFKLAALLRATLPRSLWFRLRQAATHRRLASTAISAKSRLPQPFVTIIVEPNDVLLLTVSFFSLVRQTYSAWELILLETVQQGPGVRRAMNDFSMLDERVRVVPAALEKSDRLQEAVPYAKGEYRLWLPEGATLSFDAIRQSVTLVRNRPNSYFVLADLEWVDAEQAQSIRCFNTAKLFEQHRDIAGPHMAFVFVRNTPLRPESGPLSRDSAVSSEAAHIPEVLFRFTNYESLKTLHS